MKVDGVGRVTDGAENRAFRIVGVGQHCESLIAVRGDHDMVVGIASAVTVMDDDAMSRPFDRCHGTAQPDPIPKGRRQLFHVASAAAAYCSPGWTVVLQ